MTLEHLRQQLHAQASGERAAGARRFFKTGLDEYGAGDQCLGLTLPQVRALLPAVVRWLVARRAV